MFVDSADIYVKGGDGGDGCVSFRREYATPKGGPNGGDGGNGGGVVFVASEHESSLEAMYYLPHYEGERGEHGGGKDKHGSDGRDTEVRVPLGTVVYDYDTDEKLADLTADSDSYTPVSGGKGGRGNKAFATSTNQVPRNAEKGGYGEERELRIELKMVADVGLVGYPNAGKSTLIAALSGARPKVADYPFTTLRPKVGVVDVDEPERFTVCDIPGIIENAHENAGLGLAFLKHIERCRILLFVIDISATEGRDPAEDFRVLKNELQSYQPGLEERAAVVAANKIDMESSERRLEALRRAADPLKVMAISASHGSKVGQLKAELRRQLKEMQEDT